MYSQSDSVSICISYRDFNALPDLVFLGLAEYYLAAECGMVIESWPDECVGMAQ